ncbi:hypothetical protein [Streptomyces sp. NPDC096132]|uniref:hypothetical protein n=1 Tax=Streptomyces sp. NPDC096132 TaxID=3366075 RepID=UPI0037FA724E
MASGSDSQVLDRIAELKDEISKVKTTLNTHVLDANNVTDKELTAAKDEIKEAVKKGKDETKTIWEALFESLGLKDFFEAFKQEDFWTKATLIIGALGAVIMGKLLDLGKLFNLGFEKLTKLIARRMLGRTNSQGRVLATGESGLPRALSRQQADALSAVNISPTNVTAATLNGLRDALKEVVPEIIKFNDAIRDTPSSGKINRIAKAVEKLKAKLTPDPSQTISGAATAIGALNTKLEHYDANKLPKVNDLRQVQSAAHNLAETAETLRAKFVALSNGFSGAAGSLGT